MSCKIVSLEQSEDLSAAEWPASQSLSRFSSHAPEESKGAGQNGSQASRLKDLETRLLHEVNASREAGLREGEKLGRDLAVAELAPVLERMSRGIAELAGLRARLRREAERDLVTLAVAIARRVLHREISVDAEALHGLIKSALERVQNKDACRVRTFPAYAAQLRALLDRLQSTAEIVSDASLQAGDFIIETKRGDLDASIDTQLQEIERGLADRIRH